MLQEALQVALLLDALSPPHDGPARDPQPPGHDSLGESLLEQLVRQHDLGHLSHLLSFSWTVTFLSEILRAPASWMRFGIVTNIRKMAQAGREPGSCPDGPVGYNDQHVPATSFASSGVRVER